MKLTQKEINTGNYLIAKYYGYKLAPCNNGKAWESPYPYAYQDHLLIHGLLLEHSFKKLKFHSSWDSLIPLIAKIAEENKGKDANYDLNGKLYISILTNDTLTAFQTVVEYIKSTR